MTYTSIAAAFATWETEYLPLIPSDDYPARAESWNIYTDMLCKDGELCSLQYHYCPAWDDRMPDYGSRFDALSGDREFILSAMGVTMRATRTEARADCDDKRWAADASHWRVTVKRSGKRMVTGYSMGSAHKGEPELCDVLSSLLSDASAGENGFDDFCADMGMDEDSRKAERTWKACRRVNVALARLFSASELADLRELFSDY